MRKHIAGPAELVGKLVFAHELSEHEGWGEVEHAGQKVVAPAVRHAHHHLLQNSIPFQFRFTIGPFINHSTFTWSAGCCVWAEACICMNTGTMHPFIDAYLFHVPRRALREDFVEKRHHRFGAFPAVTLNEDHCQ